MSEFLRLGLVGAGRWGRAFINTIPHVVGTRLVAVASRNPETPSLVPRGCRVETDYKGLLFAADVDAVVIAAPAPAQPEIALAAFAAKRPVLLEKPLALDVPSAERILEAAKKAGVYSLVDHVLLYHPAWLELKKRLAGKPVDSFAAHVRNMGPFRDGVSPLWDYGSHTLSAALDLFGTAPDGAEAFKESEDERGGQNWRLELSFGKAKARLFAGNLSERKEIRFEAKAGRKTLVFDDLGPHKLTENGRHVAIDPEKPLTRVVEAFAAGCASGSTDLSSLELGLRVVQTLARLG